MTAAVIRADARCLPLPDASVDLVVTSPPYFGLRSYTDGGAHYAGQIGSESTPQEWLEALWACTAEWVRVLKPEGSLFVNLGDKYQATSFDPAKRGKDTPGVQRPTITKACERCGTEFTGGPGRRFCSSFCGGSDNSPRSSRQFVPNKSLLGLPWRYAIGCMDRLGLILRAEIIWAKPNGLPESVTDRVRRAHEQVFHFTKQPRYYAAVDEIREPHISGVNHANKNHSAARSAQRALDGVTRQTMDFQFDAPNPLGKLPGSVWDIPSQPLTVPAHLDVDHFAAFPMELPRRIILGWSPPGVCTACHQGRRPVADRITGLRLDGRKRPIRDSAANWSESACADNGWGGIRTWDRGVGATITGYACGCPEPTAPTTPAVVLDPFGGTGTTALVASVLGRHGISVDLSADYCRLAAWRTTDPGERARAMQVPKPPPVSDGQEALFA